MNQLSIDFQAYARANDPLTSVDAAAAVTPRLQDLEQVVLDHLKGAEDGLTVDELVAATGMDKVTISPRLRPLVRKQLAIETEQKRPGNSGRSQTVWKAA